ncbi:MAG: M15 family metallopeptidase [Actinomycetota bacterium]|nr:M15 family metallopeptidase [Actinomycetota bacterium]
MRRAFWAALAAALVVTACGGDPTAPPSERALGAGPPIALPPAERSVPAYLMFREVPFTDAEAAELGQLDGVAVVAQAAIKQVPLSSTEESVTARVGAVDPIVFRSVTPAQTRDANFVWSEMSAGEAVATFALADALDLEDSNQVRVGTRSVTVGAYADNGVPNLADLVVNEAVGRRLGIGEPKWMVVGAEPGFDLNKLGAALDEQFESAHIVGLLPDPPGVVEPNEPEVVGEATGSLIGTMSFRILDDGFIKPNREWVRQNIAAADVPIIGEVTCHRLMIPQLHSALVEIEQRGLAGLVRADDYGGCYVPRFIDRDPSMPLSMHAFGLAFDINVSTNLLGSRGDQDPRIVEIFEKWGFTWGGRWDRPDPMHFELARIVRP